MLKTIFRQLCQFFSRVFSWIKNRLLFVFRHLVTTNSEKLSQKQNLSPCPVFEKPFWIEVFGCEVCSKPHRHHTDMARDNLVVRCECLCQACNQRLSGKNNCNDERYEQECMCSEPKVLGTGSHIAKGKTYKIVRDFSDYFFLPETRFVTLSELNKETRPWTVKVKINEQDQFTPFAGKELDYPVRFEECIELVQDGEPEPEFKPTWSSAKEKPLFNSGNKPPKPSKTTQKK